MKTRKVLVGNVPIGGGSQIAVQSMTNTNTADTGATLAQIIGLAKAGCDIVRVAVPNMLSARALTEITAKSPLPVVADIHFDHNLALAAIDNGAAKIRINPGNIPEKGLDGIIAAAKNAHVPVRLGVNGGSADKILLAKYGSKAEALTESLLGYVNYFEKRGFYDLVLSIKSSDVGETVALNERIAQKCSYPIHIGLTEAGVPDIGIVKNSIAISRLLLKGIGDTVRVSLTADPVREVYAAKEILRSLGKKTGGVEFVSCPKCGRCVIDLEGLAEKIYDATKNLNKNIKVAVMGCEVNGPGECADADIGLAGGKKISFFKNGKIYKTVESENALDEFLKEINKIENDTQDTDKSQ